MNGSQTQATVLLIEDDVAACDTMQWALEQDGFRVVIAHNGAIGLRELYQHHPDVILLDLNMPVMDGYTLCQRIREVSDVPIIVVSAREEPESIVRCLDMGADDYITKPYNNRVLVARTRANLRRASAEPVNPQAKLVYTDEYLALNLETRRILVNGEPVKLSPREFRMLEVLLQASPRVVSYRILLEEVWGFEYIDDVDYLRVYVWHLRNKIEPNPKSPIYLLNEAGAGYRFQPRA